MAVAANLLHLPGKHVLKASVVREPRELVSESLMPRFLVELDVLERHRGLCRQRLQQIEVVIAESAGSTADRDDPVRAFCRCLGT